MDHVEEVVAQCTGLIWPEAIRQHGDFPFAAFGRDILCLARGIFPDGAKDALAILRTQAIHKIVISSMGGDVDAALDIADEILARGIDVYVEGPCFSSCANYIFPAARHKYVARDGVVAWHGAPRVKPDSRPKIQRIVERHQHFFATIGVADRVTWQVPCDLRGDPDFLEAAKTVGTKHNVLWTYSRDTLERKFGISGIVQMWEPESPRELRKQELYQRVYLAQGCDA